ncbi:MAG: hypothetical protein GY765_22010 [bacterium]|nr:hypothetical protein [bacterium]
MITDEHETIFRHISYTRGIFNAALFLHYIGGIMAPAITVAAIFLLVSKVSGYPGLFPLQWLPGVVGLLAGLALSLTFKEKYSQQEAAAWLDWQAQKGGALMMLMETSPGQHCRIDCSQLPKPRITVLPTLKKIAFPMLFLLVCIIVPVYVSQGLVSTEAIHRRAAAVETHIQKASRQTVVREDEALQLQDELRRAVDNAEQTPTAAVEAVDHVQEKLDGKILDKAEKAAEKVEMLSASLSGTMDKDLMRESIQQAMSGTTAMETLPPDLQNKLAELLRKMNLSGPGNQQLSSKQLKDILNKMDAETLKKMLKALDAETLKKLAASIREAQLKALQNCGKCSGSMADAAVGKRLENMVNATCSSAMADLEKRLVGIVLGRGGIDRGRGDAPLVLGEETESSAARFKPMLLKSKGIPFPGVTLSKKKVLPQRIAPEEFRLSSRSRAKTKDGVGGTYNDGRLGPYRQKIAARYFKEK